MDALDIFAFIVFAVLIAAAMVIIVGLGSLPGAIARKRGHPQAAAVNVASWLGMATLGILWPLALIWAFSKPAGSGRAAKQEPAPTSAEDGNAQPGNMQARVDALEAAMRQLQAGKENRT
jgi:hypothetical protein